jgi:hypothetical protein
MHAAMQQYREWAKKKMDPLFVQVFRSNGTKINVLSSTGHFKSIKRLIQSSLKIKEKRPVNCDFK